MPVFAHFLLVQMLVAALIQGAAFPDENTRIMRSCINTGPCATLSNSNIAQELTYALLADEGIRDRESILREIRTFKAIEDDPVLVPVYVINLHGVCLQFDMFYWERYWYKHPELRLSQDKGLMIPHYLPFSWLLQAQRAYKGDGFVQEIDIPLMRGGVKLTLKAAESRDAGLAFIAHAAYAVANYLVHHRNITGAKVYNGTIYNDSATLLLIERVPAFRSMEPHKIATHRDRLAKDLKERAQRLIKTYYGVELNLPEWRPLSDDHAANAALLKQFCCKE